MPVVVSPTATREPTPRDPHTDDMRIMVDDLRRRCPPAMRPAAFVCDGVIYVHPDLVEKI